MDISQISQKSNQQFQQDNYYQNKKHSLKKKDLEQSINDFIDKNPTTIIKDETNNIEYIGLKASKYYIFFYRDGILYLGIHKDGKVINYADVLNFANLEELVTKLEQKYSNNDNIIETKVIETIFYLLKANVWNYIDDIKTPMYKNYDWLHFLIDFFTVNIDNHTESKTNILNASFLRAQTNFNTFVERLKTESILQDVYDTITQKKVLKDINISYIGQNQNNSTNPPMFNSVLKGKEDINSDLKIENINLIIPYILGMLGTKANSISFSTTQNKFKNLDTYIGIDIKQDIENAVKFAEKIISKEVLIPEEYGEIYISKLLKTVLELNNRDTKIPIANFINNYLLENFTQKYHDLIILYLLQLGSNIIIKKNNTTNDIKSYYNAISNQEQNQSQKNYGNQNAKILLSDNPIVNINNKNQSKHALIIENTNLHSIKKMVETDSKNEDNIDFHKYYVLDKYKILNTILSELKNNKFGDYIQKEKIKKVNRDKYDAQKEHENLTQLDLHHLVQDFQKKQKNPQIDIAALRILYNLSEENIKTIEEINTDLDKFEIEAIDTEMTELKITIRQTIDNFKNKKTKDQVNDIAQTRTILKNLIKEKENICFGLISQNRFYKPKNSEVGILSCLNPLSDKKLVAENLDDYFKKIINLYIESINKTLANNHNFFKDIIPPNSYAITEENPYKECENIAELVLMWQLKERGCEYLYLENKKRDTANKSAGDLFVEKYTNHLVDFSELKEKNQKNIIASQIKPKLISQKESFFPFVEAKNNKEDLNENNEEENLIENEFENKKKNEITGNYILHFICKILGEENLLYKTKLENREKAYSLKSKEIDLDQPNNQDDSNIINSNYDEANDQTIQDILNLKDEKYLGACNLIPEITELETENIQNKYINPVLEYIKNNDLSPLELVTRLSTKNNANKNGDIFLLAEKILNFIPLFEYYKEYFVNEYPNKFKRNDAEQDYINKYPDICISNFHNSLMSILDNLISQLSNYIEYKQDSIPQNYIDYFNSVKKLDTTNSKYSYIAKFLNFLLQSVEYLSIIETGETIKTRYSFNYHKKPINILTRYENSSVFRKTIPISLNPYNPDESPFLHRSFTSSKKEIKVLISRFLKKDNTKFSISDIGTDNIGLYSKGIYKNAENSNDNQERSDNNEILIEYRKSSLLKCLKNFISTVDKIKKKTDDITTEFIFDSFNKLFTHIAQMEYFQKWHLNIEFINLFDLIRFVYTEANNINSLDEKKEYLINVLFDIMNMSIADIYDEAILNLIDYTDAEMQEKESEENIKKIIQGEAIYPFSIPEEFKIESENINQNKAQNITLELRQLLQKLLGLSEDAPFTTYKSEQYSSANAEIVGSDNIKNILEHLQKPDYQFNYSIINDNINTDLLPKDYQETLIDSLGILEWLIELDSKEPNINWEQMLQFMFRHYSYYEKLIDFNKIAAIYTYHCNKRLSEKVNNNDKSYIQEIKNQNENARHVLIQYLVYVYYVYSGGMNLYDTLIKNETNNTRNIQISKKAKQIFHRPQSPEDKYIEYLKQLSLLSKDDFSIAGYVAKINANKALFMPTNFIKDNQIDFSECTKHIAANNNKNYNISVNKDNQLASARIPESKEDIKTELSNMFKYLIYNNTNNIINIERTRAFKNVLDYDGQYFSQDTIIILPYLKKFIELYKDEDGQKISKLLGEIFRIDEYSIYNNPKNISLKNNFTNFIKDNINAIKDNNNQVEVLKYSNWYNVLNTAIYKILITAIHIITDRNTREDNKNIAIKGLAKTYEIIGEFFAKKNSINTYLPFTISGAVESIFKNEIPKNNITILFSRIIEIDKAVSQAYLKNVFTYERTDFSDFKNHIENYKKLSRIYSNQELNHYIGSCIVKPLQLVGTLSKVIITYLSFKGGKELGEARLKFTIDSNINLDKEYLDFIDEIYQDNNILPEKINEKWWINNSNPLENKERKSFDIHTNLTDTQKTQSFQQNLKINPHQLNQSKI
ncbi:MAG: hypothetical protein N4A49_08300 [Marinifilaceae bacterium]|jgi:hypothetical protein|nr:hypothetical protein [Marinifilaceae bacterium]